MESTEQHIEDTITEAIRCAAERDFAGFDEQIAILDSYGLPATLHPVENRMLSVLASELSTSPRYDTIVAVSRGLHDQLKTFFEGEPFLYECVLRRFYGDSQLTAQVPGNALQAYMLAVAGVLTGPVPTEYLARRANLEPR